MNENDFNKKDPAQLHPHAPMDEENTQNTQSEIISEREAETDTSHGAEFESHGAESESHGADNSATSESPGDKGKVSLSAEELGALIHQAYLRGRNENIEARIDNECETRKPAATATDLLLRGLAGAAKTLFRPGRRSIWPKRH